MRSQEGGNGSAGQGDLHWGGMRGLSSGEWDKVPGMEKRDLGQGQVGGDGTEEIKLRGNRQKNVCPLVDVPLQILEWNPSSLSLSSSTLSNYL